MIDLGPEGGEAGRRADRHRDARSRSPATPTRTPGRFLADLVEPRGAEGRAARGAREPVAA